jgi:HEPN domain-containing protein
MPPLHHDPSDPAEWLRRARSSLAEAKAGRTFPGVIYEDWCFDAQQAAGKAIKAVLVSRQVPYPKTHSIRELLSLWQQSGMAVPEEVRRAGLLTGYAVETRYPGLSEEVTEEEYLEAVALAERVLNWAESVIRAGK